MCLADCALVGNHRLEILGLVDSGASVTYVTAEAHKRAGLEPTGKSQKFMCGHGQHHAGIETKSYFGVVALGTVRKRDGLRD